MYSKNLTYTKTREQLQNFNYPLRQNQRINYLHGGAGGTSRKGMHHSISGWDCRKSHAAGGARIAMEGSIPASAAQAASVCKMGSTHSGERFAPALLQEPSELVLNHYKLRDSLPFTPASIGRIPSSWDIAAGELSPPAGPVKELRRKRPNSQGEVRPNPFINEAIRKGACD